MIVILTIIFSVLGSRDFQASRAHDKRITNTILTEMNPTEERKVS